MANTETGVILELGDTKQVSEKFQVRELIMHQVWNSRFGETENFIKFQFVQQNCEKLDAYQVGDKVTISFNLDGRRLVDDQDGSIKYFTNVTGYAIDKLSSAQSQQPTQKVAEKPVDALDSFSDDTEPADPDDLPFK